MEFQAVAPIAETLALAWRYHQAGVFLQAEQLYQQVLQGDPAHADAWCLLAAVCQAQGKHQEAAANYQQALQLRPTYFEAHNNLGNTFLALGKVDEALAHFQEALRLRPNGALIHNNLGLALDRLGQRQEAVEHWREALRLQPDLAEVNNNLANALQSFGDLDQATAYYREAIRLNPTYAAAHNNLGNVLRHQWRLQEAIESYRRALQIEPNFPEALCNLGAALEPQGAYDQAIACYHQALRIRPDYPEALNNLGIAYMGQGRLDKAAESFKDALRVRPDLTAAHSSYLLCNNYRSNADLDFVFKEHCDWGKKYAASTTEEHDNDPSPNRRLRIGYFSPDLRFHAVTRYLEPVLASHDPNKVEVFCYAQVVHPDEVTRRLQKLAHHWRSVCGLSDSDVAEQIRRDAIDILVDLAGHTAGNRLRVFGLKPAPIQVTWLGYLNTTGLPTMDYRLTDEILDPPGQPVLDTEELFRLPGGFCCFGPPDDAPAVAPLPALRRGFITFGSLHNLFKLNDKVLDLWSSVLKALPSARLMVFRDTLNIEGQARLKCQFAERGIALDRLDLRQAVDARRYLAIYEEIDIGLDAFPWTGGVTTCESLWMGVPVASLRGPRPAHMNSAALLARVGLSDWAVETSEQFVEKAVQIARDFEPLATLRSQLRGRMEKSICDAAGFTRKLEDGYRTMWRRWGEGKSKK